MPVTNVEKSLDTMTMTITAEYDEAVERCWKLWADPRQLERWWGPPTYPATFVDYDLTSGGFASYFMTGPDGDKPYGWWRIVAVDAPHRLELEDGFGEQPGDAGGMPVTKTAVRLDDRGDGGTRMTITSTFESREAMQKMLDMGMAEGMQEAMGQIEDVLASS